MNTQQNPQPVTIGTQPSFWNRMAGHFVGAALVGIVTGIMRYSMWVWIPAILGTIMSLMGWKVTPPESLKDKGHHLIESMEKLTDKASDGLKKVREEMEEAKAKAKLEIERIEAKTAKEKEVLAKRIADMELKAGEDRRKLVEEIREKAAQKERELALKVATKVVEHRVETAAGGLSSLLPSWGKPAEQEPAPDPTKTMVHLVSQKFRVPNAKCQYCSALLVIGALKMKELPPPEPPVLSPVTPYDLKMLETKDIKKLPTEGKRLIVLARVGGSLYYRIFDEDGAVVIDTYHKDLKSAEETNGSEYVAASDIRTYMMRYEIDLDQPPPKSTYGYRRTPAKPDQTTKDRIMARVAWTVGYQKDVTGSWAKAEWEKARDKYYHDRTMQESENAKFPVRCPNCKETIYAVEAQSKYGMDQQFNQIQQQYGQRRYR